MCTTHYNYTQWTKLTINTTDEAVDWVYTLLIDADYGGDICVVPYTKCDNFSPWTFTIELHLGEDTHTYQHIDKISKLLIPLQHNGMTDKLEVLEVESKLIKKASIFQRRICDRFLIVPAHQTHINLLPNDIIIKMKPSLAFGSGFHPATILSLQLLEKYVTPGMYALDMGCGSGILSIALAKLGASVLAVDNDVIAVKTTKESVLLNNVDAQVIITEGSLGKGITLGHWMGQKIKNDIQVINTQQKFNLIVANIFARTHITLVKDYQQALVKNGILILSGFIDDYTPSIISTMEKQKFSLIGKEKIREWESLAFILTV